MLFSKLFTAAMVGAAAAAPAGHVHNQHKRGLVVVTETQVVYVTADVNQVVAGESTTQTFSTLNTNLASQSSQSTTVTLQGQAVGASTYSYSAPETTGNADTTSVATVQTTASTSSSSTSAAATTTDSSSGDFTGGSKGVTYSPYTSSGNCKSLSEVQSDLAKLTDYEIIRLYGVDCNQVENVFQAKADGQKLFLGIFFMDQIEAGVKQIASAVESYGSWDDVYTVSVGNELVNGGAASVSQVAGYVSTARSALKSAGYSGPVVSVDTHIATINNPGLCDISDYVAINAHAYFDYNTEAADAGEWLLLQIQRVWTACGGSKSVLVTETGWPHQGDTYGKAVASPEAQASALSSIKASCGSSAILFNAFDDLWKADGAQNCEKYWGIY
ncbi:CYFA0S09e04434g1_1 [Cyberlindnera fabianii]|uniref:CYFA0S09e04434g1_1 n=1 Tax=Cyberlindnera fabianii TaxID=36022 RepID=A0A061AZ34_CYBFA|nr:CYFA0S09e04434g1_1 [Cyberlindnera fabianii]